MNPDRLYRMALAARICRKIRGYRSDGSGGPEQVYGVGVRPHSKAAGIHMVFGKAKGGQMVFGKATGIHMTFPFMSGSRIYAYLRCSRCLGSIIYAYLHCFSPAKSSLKGGAPRTQRLQKQRLCLGHLVYRRRVKAQSFRAIGQRSLMIPGCHNMIVGSIYLLATS